MINVFEPKKAICIRLKENSSDFIVRDLETLSEKLVPLVNFYGSNFKYEGEFEREFLKVFHGKYDILISSDARQKIEEIIHFNRVDW